MSDALLDRIAAAENLTELDSVRVALLGKSGEITARLKSLGSMDPATRNAEAPAIHKLREAVTGAIADRKAALETAEKALGTDIARWLERPHPHDRLGG